MLITGDHVYIGIDLMLILQLTTTSQVSLFLEMDTMLVKL